MTPQAPPITDLPNVVEGAFLLCCGNEVGHGDALRSHIEHLIVSRHGSQEHGAPVEPDDRGAFIWPGPDDLDAKGHQIRHAVRNDLGEFAAYEPRLARVLWNGTRRRGARAPADTACDTTRRLIARE